MPTIPTLPPYPSRGSAPDTFSLMADAFVAAMPNWGVQVQAVGDQAAADAATATAAMSSAVAAANYKGTYSAGTTYQIGESVTYGGARYYAKTVNTGVTPVDGANWGLINEIPSVLGNTGKVLKAVASAPAWGAAVDIQEFTSSGTWTKPAGCAFVMVELLGAGGGGGSGCLGASGTDRGGGGGGGGGARQYPVVFKAEDLGATVSVMVGAGGVGGAAKTGTTGIGNAGSSGGTSQFGTYVYAYGGKGGEYGPSSVSSCLSKGHGGSGVSLQLFSTDSAPHGLSTIGAYCSTSSGGGVAEWGGGAGCPTNGNGVTAHAGGSMYGGAGGGCGASVNTGNAAGPLGVNGGACGSYSQDTGGAKGTSGASPTAGAAGAAPTAPNMAGDGGGGGGAGTTGSGGAGGAGGRGSGGGGGGAGTGAANSSGAGGNGGAGYCRVTSW